MMKGGWHVSSPQTLHYKDSNIKICAYINLRQREWERCHQPVPKDSWKQIQAWVSVYRHGLSWLREGNQSPWHCGWGGRWLEETLGQEAWAGPRSLSLPFPTFCYRHFQEGTKVERIQWITKCHLTTPTVSTANSASHCIPFAHTEPKQTPDITSRHFKYFGLHC